MGTLHGARPRLRRLGWTTTTFAAAVGLFSVALAGCGSSGESSAGGSQDCNLKLGILEPLSGAAAGLGKPATAAAKMAAEDINANGGVNGCKVELAVEDYKSDPGTAVVRVRRLIDQGVYGIIGPNQGSATLAIRPIINSSKIPICAFNNTISITEGDNPYIFRCHSNDRDNVKATILYLKQKYDAKRIAVVHTDDAYGTEAADALEEVAKSGPTKIIVTAKISYPYSAKDATSEWARAKATNPDAYVLWGSGTSQPVALRAAQRLGTDKPIIGGQGLTTSAVIEASGSAAEGIYAIGLFDPSTVTKSQQRITELLKEAHGADYQPTSFDYTGWDAVHLFAQAYKANPDDAQAGMESLHSATLAAGTYTFSADDHDGLGLGSIWVTQVKNGKFVGIKTGLSEGGN